MATESILSKETQNEIQSKLASFSQTKDKGNLLEYIYRNDTLLNGLIELSFFITGEEPNIETGPPKKIYFKIAINEDAVSLSTTEENKNLETMNKVIQMTTEIEDIVQETIGTTIQFTNEDTYTGDYLTAESTI